MKTPRSITSYRRNFEELVDALRLSADSYDKGFLGEAKRLAVCARVLLHDTNKSTSVFQQLGIKRKISFLGSPNPYTKENLLTECHLVLTHIAAQPTYLPLLDTNPMGTGWQQLPFDTWWDETVIRDKHQAHFSRKDLVQWFANKEGGAHVDPFLDEKYRRLQEENSFGWIFQTGGKEVQATAGVELACMRQITHELIRTIEKNNKVIRRQLT